MGNVHFVKETNERDDTVLGGRVKPSLSRLFLIPYYHALFNLVFTLLRIQEEICNCRKDYGFLLFCLVVDCF